MTGITSTAADNPSPWMAANLRNDSMKPSIKPFDVMRDLLWGIAQQGRVFSKKKLLAAVEMADDISPTGRDDDIVAEARAQYACDDIAIDDYPLLSKGDGGAWVNAWVWIDVEENNERG